MTNYPPTFQIPTGDELTGLLSAMYYRHLLRETLLPQAAAGGEPLSMALFDIDRFAEWNEEKGAAFGDLLLQSVAATIREAMPERAVLARYGGDEFGIALPNTRLDDAFTLMEALRQRVAALRWEQAPEVEVRCSIGLAAYPAHAKSEVELVREADQALYQAKVTGRNKVALPLEESRMITKTSYYTGTQLERLADLARAVGRPESTLLREALDDLLKKYNDRLGAPPQEG